MKQWTTADKNDPIQKTWDDYALKTSHSSRVVSFTEQEVIHGERMKAWKRLFHLIIYRLYGNIIVIFVSFCKPRFSEIDWVCESRAWLRATTCYVSAFLSPLFYLPWLYVTILYRRRYLHISHSISLLWVQIVEVFKRVVLNWLVGINSTGCLKKKIIKW